MNHVFFCVGFIFFVFSIQTFRIWAIYRPNGSELFKYPTSSVFGRWLYLNFLNGKEFNQGGLFPGTRTQRTREGTQNTAAPSYVFKSIEQATPTPHWTNLCYHLFFVVKTITCIYLCKLGRHANRSRRSLNALVWGIIICKSKIKNLIFKFAR